MATYETWMATYEQLLLFKDTVMAYKCINILATKFMKQVQ